MQFYLASTYFAFIRLKYSVKPLALERPRHLFFLTVKKYISYITGRQADVLIFSCMDNRQKKLRCVSKQVCSRHSISFKNLEYVSDFSQPFNNYYTVFFENVRNVILSLVVC